MLQTILSFVIELKFGKIQGFKKKVANTEQKFKRLCIQSHGVNTERVRGTGYVIPSQIKLEQAGAELGQAQIQLRFRLR